MENVYAVTGTQTEVPAAQEGGEGGGLAFNIYTFGFSILNIIILFVLLKLWLFGPVTKILNNRTERIKKNISDSEASRVEADKLKEEYRGQLEKIKEETTSIINSAHQKAQAEAEELLKKARKEAELILTKAREEGEREVQKALEAVKNQVASLALQAASKVIQANMDTDANKKLVDEFLNEVGAA